MLSNKGSIKVENETITTNEGLTVIRQNIAFKHVEQTQVTRNGWLKLMEQWVGDTFQEFCKDHKVQALEGKCSVWEYKERIK